jgi:pSer/pThr/pTyr-binding forkhead associated (FHA) protein
VKCRPENELASKPVDSERRGRDSSTPTSVRLRYRNADVFLSQGQYVLGRSATCEIVIDDARVSRRHAQIEVTRDGVTLQDLGSVNGVFVNGHRLPLGIHPLQDADRIVIGGAELLLRLGPVSSEHPVRRSPRPTVGRPVTESARPSRPSESKASSTGLPGSFRPVDLSMDVSDSEPPQSAVRSFDDAPTSGSHTQRANIFELVGPIATKALAAGRTEEAESILVAHLGKVLEDSKRNRPMDPLTRERALHYAIELAAATGAGKWFNYAFDLLIAHAMPIDAKLGTRLYAALARVDSVDAQRVSRYVSTLHAEPQSFEKVRALQQAEELLKAATRKR